MWIPAMAGEVMPITGRSAKSSNDEVMSVGRHRVTP